MSFNVFQLKKIKASLVAALLLVILSGGTVSVAAAPPDGAKVTQSASCKNYKDDAKKACGFGYGATLGDKARARTEKSGVPTKDYNGEESVDAKDACTKYKVASNKSACQKGYKDGHYAYYHKTDHSPLVKTPTKVTTGECQPGSDACTDPAATPNPVQCDNNNCDFIAKFINPAINTLTACFGLLAIISLILGGINYSTSEGDPQKVSRAKNRIFNTILAVIAYIFLYAFLEFLVPGGAFK